MANEKILNTRIQLKYDEYSKWNSSSLELKKGEIALAMIETKTTDAHGNIVNVPTVVMKVGTGETGDKAKFANLPYVSALAADVHAWAKQSKTDFMNNFLAMEDDNGESMQKKLDTVFASNDELTQAIGDFQNALAEALKNYYAKDEVDAITGDLSKLNTENKGNLVAAINEALQAVEVGGTGSVVTVADQSGADSIKFVVKQGGNAVSVPIEFGAGDGLDHGTASATAGTGTIPTIKLSDATKASLAKADTALQEHQSLDHKADKVSGATAGNFAGLDANGNLTDSGKKAADFAPADIDTGVHSVSLTGGTDNGTLKLIVDGTETDKIAVTGLQSAAYATVESLNATAKEYADAVEAKLPTSANYGVLSVAAGDQTITIGGDAQHPTIAVTPETFDDYGAAAAVLGESTDPATANTVYGVKAAVAAAQNDATIAKTKIETFLGTVTPDGSQDIIDTLTEINTYVGEHGQEFATLSGKVTNIENGTTATKAGDLTAELEAEIKGYTVANATKAADADKLGGQAPAYYATAESVNDITKTNGAIDNKIAAYDTSKGFGDIITRNAAEFATSSQGANADTAHGWGNHADAGYAKANDLGALAEKDTISEGDIDGTIAASKITNFAAEVKAVKVDNAGHADSADSADNANHASAADTATKATQDADGNVISTTYAKSANIADSLAKADSAVQSVGFSEQDGSVVLAVNAQDYSFSEIEGVEGVEVGLGVGVNSGKKSLEIKIADAGVTTTKIADAAITSAKIADHAISTHHMKACADYTGEDAEVWIFNCGGAE